MVRLKVGSLRTVFKEICRNPWGARALPAPTRVFRGRRRNRRIEPGRKIALAAATPQSAAYRATGARILQTRASTFANGKHKKTRRSRTEASGALTKGRKPGTSPASSSHFTGRREKRKHKNAGRRKNKQLRRRFWLMNSVVAFGMQTA